MQLDDAEIIRRFTYHAPGDEQRTKYERLRTEAAAFAFLIRELVPESREQALALTKLEEAVMHANSGIARRS